MLTQHFDGKWAFSGADSTTATPDGTVLVQHFDRGFTFTGADRDTNVASGSWAVEHFDQNWMLVGSSATVPPAVVSSNLMLKVSTGVAQSDAQFTVSIDGRQAGGTFTAAASHQAGQSQSINWTGLAENFAAHDIAITFLNSLTGGVAPAQNLYIDSLSYDGKSVTNGPIAITSNTTQHFTVLAPVNWSG